MLDEQNGDFSENMRVVIVVLAVLLWIIYFCLLITSFVGIDDTGLRPFFEKYVGAGVAVPLAGLSSFLLVSLLQINAGPIRFEGLGFKFHGAAGPAVFWVICFLAIIGGIRLVP